MRKISALVVALGIAAASLSSCSRSNYAFNTTAPTQLGAGKAQAVAPTGTTVAATTQTAPDEAAPVYQGATVVAHLPVPAPAVTKEVTRPVAVATQPAAPEAVVTNKIASVKAKPSLMQRVALNGLTKKLNKLQQKQATAKTTTDSSLLHTALYVGLAGLIAILIGVLIAGGSISGGSGAGFTIGVILAYLGQIALLVGIILLIVALVKN